MKKCLALNEINPGDHAIVRKIESEGSIRRRFMDIGLVRNTKIECVGRSIMGDPSAYLIRGAIIAVRSDDGRSIFVEKIEGKEQ